MSSDLEFFLKIPVTLFPEKLVHAKTVNQGCMLSGDSAAAITTIVVQNLDVEEHKQRDLGFGISSEGVQTEAGRTVKYCTCQENLWKWVNDAEVCSKMACSIHSSVFGIKLQSFLHAFWPQHSFNSEHQKWQR